jgi:hypothetical protein
MQYFYIETAKGDVYGSFDSKSEALRFVDQVGFDCDWTLIDSASRDADVDEYDEADVEPDHWNIDK